MAFRWCNESRVGRPAVAAKSRGILALRALQAATADLQAAAAGPMTAEKQPTWTDDS